MPFPEADPGPSYQILQITINFIICVSIVWENVFRVSAFASQHNKTVRGANTFGTSLHLIMFTCSPAEQEKKMRAKKYFSDIKRQPKKRESKLWWIRQASVLFWKFMHLMNISKTWAGRIPHNSMSIVKEFLRFHILRPTSVLAVSDWRKAWKATKIQDFSDAAAGKAMHYDFRFQ